MERMVSIAGAAAVAALGLFACQTEYTRYSDAEYIMFADESAVYAVEQGGDYFKVPVVSTVTRDYDRTIGVEIVDDGSNAIERRHYMLRSNTLTIKAGQTRTDVEVKGIYDNIGDEDSLGFVLRLVIPEQLRSPLYGTETKVVMQKVCPYVRENFTGWCVVTSMFLYQYGISGYQRLIQTVPSANDPDAVILKNFFYDGYDVSIRFKPGEPLEPLVDMDSGQTISDTGSAFGITYGDGRLLCGASPVYPSYFNPCGNFVELWLNVYVEDLGDMYGTVGQFYNVLEWISDEEADRLHREGGM
ncbi:MAG: DUF4984 domain-containing protein [Alistipes sp.]|nr:DUF4984 domain-containing protein [Alistipes sp.]